jgi:hypothetical protein
VRAAALVFAVASLATAPALAADYPYSGYFTAQSKDMDADTAQLLCAVSFFLQRADGTYANYHLDRPAFERDGSVRFVFYGAGECTIEARTMVEACTISEDTVPGQAGQLLFDVVEAMTPDRIDLANFDTREEAETFAAGGGDRDTSANGTRFTRCSGYDADIAGFLKTARSTLSMDERMALITPELDDRTRAMLTTIRDTIRKGR